MSDNKGFEYQISTDKDRLDLALVHDFLTKKSHWAAGISFDKVAKSVANSLCFGVYDAHGQVGFARIITDRTTFAILGDVFVLDAHRGKGLAKRLVETILAHEDMQGLRRIMLVTTDAHALYSQFGFNELKYPERFMEVIRQIGIVR